MSLSTEFKTMTNKISRANDLAKAVIACREYEKIQYIEGSGTQYIKTNILYNANYKINIDFLSIDTPVNTSIFTATNTWNASNVIVTLESGYTITNYYQSSISTTAYASNSRKLLGFYRGQNFVNGVLKSGSANANSNAVANSTYITLLGTPNGQHLHNKSRIYGFSVVDMSTNETISNCIPVKRITDAAICLYDLVKNTYYTNTGSGTFIAGPSIE